MTWKPIATFVCVVLLVVLAAFVYHRSRGAGESVDERAGIAALFKGRTSTEAYAAFKKKFTSASTADQHNAAHMFGELLYAKEGIQGFSICDGSFGFGCAHTFIPLALFDHGVDAVGKFDAACVQAFGSESLGCFHGIGHGLGANFGYSTDGLSKALALCDTLSWKKPYGGCRDGVFMEFNARLMASNESQKGRPFSIDERLVPCTTVPEDARVACYFELPTWWENSFPTDPTKYERMQSYCAEVRAPASREACFRGIGYAIAPGAAFDPTRGDVSCDILKAHSVQRLQCREGLAWALWADPQYRSGADTACTEGLSTADATACKAQYLFTIK